MSSATAFLAQSSSTNALPAVVAAMSAGRDPAILDPMDRELMASLLAADALLLWFNWQLAGAGPIQQEQQLEELRRRLADRHISLELTDAAKALLAEEGFDPVYGARPLKRVIQHQIADPLAMKILAGEFGDGDPVTVDARGGELTFGASEVLRV